MKIARKEKEHKRKNFKNIEDIEDPYLKEKVEKLV